MRLSSIARLILEPVLSCARVCFRQPGGDCGAPGCPVTGRGNACYYLLCKRPRALGPAPRGGAAGGEKGHSRGRENGASGSLEAWKPARNGASLPPGRWGWATREPRMPLGSRPTSVPARFVRGAPQAPQAVVTCGSGELRAIAVWGPNPPTPALSQASLRVTQAATCNRRSDFSAGLSKPDFILP